MSTDALPRHRQLGLTDQEAERIPELLGREPTDPELVMFSLMWSEHCSYKHSKPLLRAFPTEGPHILQGPGENAGAIDVGDGIAIAFKIESHNHPSAVEPFEGAATGVGGIVRDIIAMGARPIALLDSLRFGELTSQRSRYLFRRAVAGIGHYGNCIGVPTVGGEVGFDDCYEDSCLVNAMCVGVVPHDGILRAAAKGVGNRLILFGNKTGRDGIGGASVLASAEFSHDEDKRPSVQVSDPFTERKLMDCCADLAERGLFVALQDLGAAGLTSAASEMASKGGLGLRIDLDLVPLREDVMAPAEILVSESQERMLAEVTPDNLDAVIAICRDRFDLDATDIGEVTDGDRLVATFGGEVVVDIPAHFLADDAPVYEVPQVPAPAPVALDLATVPEPADLADAWLALLARPTIASKRWVYEQYDCLVGADTGAAYLVDPRSPRLVPCAGYRVPKDMLATLLAFPLPLGKQGFESEVWEARRPVFADNVPSDPRFGYELFKLFRHQAGLVLPAGVTCAVVLDPDGQTSRRAAHAPGRESISRRASCFCELLPSASTSCRMLRAPSGSPMSM